MLYNVLSYHANFTCAVWIAACWQYVYQIGFIPSHRFTCVQYFDFYYVDIEGLTITPGEPLNNVHHTISIE